MDVCGINIYVQKKKKKKRMNDKNGIKLRSMMYRIGVSFKKEFSDIFKNN